MRCLLLLWWLPALCMAAEHEHGTPAAEAPVDHSSHAGTAEVPATVHDHAAMTAAAPVPALSAAARHTVMHEHGGMLNQFWMLDRFERQQQDGQDVDLWDAQGWFGGDYHKLWLKTEGQWQAHGDRTDEAELQALYSRAIAPFWDVQAGIRHAEGTAASRSYAVVGVQGLAPYWFEVDAALFIDDRSGVQLRLDTDYDLRLTQKWILQPRVELNYAFNDDVGAGIAQGTSDSSIALRLRYEVVREFAPYVGVERSIGGHRQGNDTRVVAGVRLWY